MKLKVDVGDGRKVFFTSDFHLFHKNVIRYDGRPFYDDLGKEDLHAMHSTILTNWNNVVRQKDVVFYLGDLCFGRMEWAKEFVDQLNGTIHYIMGNHDKWEDIWGLNRFSTVYDYVDLLITGIKHSDNASFAMMHYPIHSWNKAKHGTYMIHGHCHMSLSEKEFHQDKRIYDVGCNGWNYTPVEFREILELGKNINFKTTSKHH